MVSLVTATKMQESLARLRGLEGLTAAQQAKVDRILIDLQEFWA
jgi:hypothetical protein